MKKIEILLLVICIALLAASIVIVIIDTNHLWISFVMALAAIVIARIAPNIECRARYRASRQADIVVMKLTKVYTKFQDELERTTDPFMKELLKSGMSRLQAGQDPDAVVDWSYKIERLYRKL